MLLTRHSLKDSCTAVYKLHASDRMQNISFSLFTLHVAHNLSSFLYYFQIICFVIVAFFKLHVAHTLQNTVFAIVFSACGLHITESSFADFPLHVAHILQNPYSIIFTLFMVLHC